MSLNGYYDYPTYVEAKPKTPKKKKKSGGIHGLGGSDVGDKLLNLTLSVAGGFLGAFGTKWAANQLPDSVTPTAKRAIKNVVNTVAGGVGLFFPKNQHVNAFAGGIAGAGVADGILQGYQILAKTTTSETATSKYKSNEAVLRETYEAAETVAGTDDYDDDYTHRPTVSDYLDETDYHTADPVVEGYDEIKETPFSVRKLSF